MNPPLSLDFSSTESDQRSSEEGTPSRNNTPAVFNSPQLSGAMARETITFSSVASQEPQIVTIDSDSNEPTIPYGFGNQNPIVPPSLDDLNLIPNPFNVLAKMTVIQPDKEYSPQSPELSNPSPIATPSMNLSTIEGWESPHTTTFFSEGELISVFWPISSSKTFNSNEPTQVSITSSPSSTPRPPRRQKRKIRMEISFPKDGRVSLHTCEACGQVLPVRKTP